MDTPATPAASPAAIPAPRMNGQKFAKIGAVVFVIYLAMLYSLVGDQFFHWGLYPTKLERDLTAQVAQLGDTSLSAEQRLELQDKIVSWHSFAVPVLIAAIEKNSPGVRDPASQCLVEIAHKFYNTDISAYATDPDKLKTWWAGLQAQWETMDKN
jgi:hypothetical protein